MGERSLALETEPGIGERAWDQRDTPRIGKGLRGGGEPRIGEETQTGRGLGNVGAFGFWGKVVWGMRR